jgi:hypothetical protein
MAMSSLCILVPVAPNLSAIGANSAGASSSSVDSGICTCPPVRSLMIVVGSEQVCVVVVVGVWCLACGVRRRGWPAALAICGAGAGAQRASVRVPEGLWCWRPKDFVRCCPKDFVWWCPKDFVLLCPKACVLWCPKDFVLWCPKDLVPEGLCAVAPEGLCAVAPEGLRSVVPEGL